MAKAARRSLLVLAVGFLINQGAYAQTADSAAKPAPASQSVDRSSAYYHFAMGHLYAELAGLYGNRGEYLNKAIDHYKQAMKADPTATFLSSELSDLYMQAGRLSDAVTEAEDTLKQDPDNLDARRILGRIYTRMIGDTQQGKINDVMLKRAIEQYQKITSIDDKDVESWLMLGRLQNAAHNSVESLKAFKKALEIDPDNDDAISGLARVYSDLGDTKNAIAMLKKATEGDPNPHTLIALANAYEQMRDYASAAEAERQALQFAPDNVEIKRALAQYLLLAEKTDEALKTYLELAAQDPEDVQTQIRLSQIYRQQRNFAKADEASKKAKALDPNNLEVRYNEVNLLEAEGKLPDAINALKAMVDSTVKKSYSASERNSRVLLLERLGFLYRSAEQYQKAIDAFSQIAQVDPDSAPRSAVQIIDTYRLAKDMPRAEQEADAAYKKYPNDRAVIAMHASILADTGKPEQAVAEMKKLLDGKDDRETYLNIAQVYEKAKKFDEMAKALDDADKLSKSKEEKETISFMRGAMYERMKKYDAAEAEFRKVLESNPKNSSALNYLGYMLADRNTRLQEAHDLISRALEIDPQNGAYLDSLGWVYYRMDRLSDAENYLRQALERISRDPTVHDHLGDVYFRQGKLKDAITQWQASLKEWETSPRSEFDPAEIVKVQKKLEDAKVRLARESAPK